MGSFREEKRDLDLIPPESIAPQYRPMDWADPKGVAVARGADGTPLTIARGGSQGS